MTIRIRDAKETDIPALQTLAELCLQQLIIGDKKEAMIARMMKRIYSSESLQRSINSDSSTLLIAEFEGEIAGMCHFGSPLMDECIDSNEIHRLLIHPDYQQKGVASELIATIEDDLYEETDILRLTVYVDPADKARVRFFAKQGFFHDQVEDKDGEWYMEKDF